ncbi:MAG: beta-ketoacyl-ACP synthase II [Chloroflexota bacterium]
MRRVVVTGMGVVCPTGNIVEEAWTNAAAGKSGVRTLERPDMSRLEIKMGGEVVNFDADKLLGRRNARRADRVTQLALVAAQQAMEDSGLEITDENRYEVGCIVGSGIGGIETLVDSVNTFEEKGRRGISPLAVPMMLIDATAAKISIEFGLRGPNYNITTACATGNNSIGEAAEKIRLGQMKAMLAGGAESGFVEIAVSSFNNMTALSRRNDEPERASRPFDADRDGFVMGEGAAVLVLEDMEHAKARGATIYAEILGYGHTSDAHHITAPMETGEGATKAMEIAMREARINADQIDYINAHGTSTPLNDKSETLAIKNALGEAAYNIPVSSTKSVTGHLLGAAGAVEAVFSIMAICKNIVPPTINLETPDPACDLNYVPNTGIEHPVHIAMSNSFGFGGHNAVLIFGEYNKSNGNS